MSSLQSPIVRPTLCRLCGLEFPNNNLNEAALIGANPQAKIAHVQALIGPMMKHLTKRHPQQLQWAQMLGSEWAGLLMMNFFQCDSATIEANRDETRWKIHGMTRRVAISDERIAERLSLAVRQVFSENNSDSNTVTAMTDAWMQGPIGKSIVETMRMMRDVLEERGRYAQPKVPVMDQPAASSPPPNGAV